jgi:hypothetical protein
MTEVIRTGEPAPRRFLPILLVAITLVVSSWACATALERSAPAAGLAGSSATVPVGTPADRLDLP